MKLRTRLLAMGVLFPLVVPVLAQQAPPPAPKQDPAKQSDQKPPEQKKEDPKEEKSPYKKYSDVITDKAVSQDGMFKVHRIDDRVFFEIPETMLDKELLWQTELAQLPNNVSYPGEGAGTRVVCFSRRNTKLFLKNCDSSIRSVGDDATRLGVELSTLQPLLMAWDIQTEGKIGNSKSVVIDVTQLFTSDPADFAVKGIVGGAGVDPGRSYVDKIKAFPTNIETRSMLTFVGGRPASPFASGPSANTALVHYSLVKLPDDPMEGRYKDSRIGFFTQPYTQYGSRENRVEDKEFINRFRLEKKDPSLAVSEPVKPIVFYVAREVPDRWREAIKKGIEDWKPAFEQAGFKNAIIAKDAPSIKEDPDWDAEDARYSVIRWVPSPVANAMGPSIQDPRSGETISAHVIFWSNITDLVTNWYYAQCAAIDPRARNLPMNEGLMQELVRYVAAHEVGHTLGLEHNFKASAWYTVAQLRDPAFTSENGVGASIMDYSRFNYVAQPGDGVTRTIGMVGPYDKFAIEYGYKPIPGATNPDAEKPALDAILARQIDDPRLRFGNYKFSQDPTTQSEDISSDAVAAAKLGLKNIDLIATNYLWTSTTRFGDDYSRLDAMRGELMQQRLLEINHVIRLVGGVTEMDNHVGRGGFVFTPVPSNRQKEAVLFLTTQAMVVPAALYEKRVISNITPNGTVAESTMVPRLVLMSLLADNRIARMVDNETANPATAYKVENLVSDITDNIWAGIAAPTPKISQLNRTIQQVYLDTMDKKVNGGNKNDLRLIAKAELANLSEKLAVAIPRTGDKMTKLHLIEARNDIQKILDNKYSTPAPVSANSLLSMFGVSGAAVSPDNCWSFDLMDPDLRKELENSSK